VKAQFAMVVHDDDGSTRHFAAGAAGGGHGNQRCNSLVIRGEPPSIVA
jgi:hypothetical protein